MGEEKREKKQEGQELKKKKQIKMERREQAAEKTWEDKEEPAWLLCTPDVKFNARYETAE